MKKLLALLLAGVLACGLTACGGTPTAEEDANSGDGTNASTEKVYNIGICQLVQHDALDAATKGFQDVLTEKLGADSVKFDVQNASNETANCEIGRASCRERV